MRLRDSVSNWIVSGTDPDVAPIECESLGSGSSLAYPSYGVDAPTLFPDLEQEIIYAPEDPFSSSLLGKKRTSSLNFSVDKLTVAPSEIFSQVFDNIQKELSVMAPAAIQTTSSLLPPSPEPPKAVTKKTPRKTVQEPPRKKQKLTEPIEQYEDEHEVVQRIPPKKSVSTYTIKYNISFGKRANGNQQWDIGCLAPPKIGKMRRMTFKLTCDSKDSPSGLSLTARCIDLSPGKHKGKLVLCSNDRCCEKKKVEGSRKAITECDQRLNELTVPVNFSEGKCTVEFFLKPEWNGMGENKLRPPFEINVSLDLPNGESISLDTWETELQSHKFESSTKGKAMESNGPVSKSGDAVVTV